MTGIGSLVCVSQGWAPVSLRGYYIFLLPVVKVKLSSTAPTPFCGWVPRTQAEGARLARPARGTFSLPMGPSRDYLAFREVIRMYETLLGRSGFRKGMDRYFELHDGKAVTCDDFRQAMQETERLERLMTRWKRENASQDALLLIFWTGLKPSWRFSKDHPCEEFEAGIGMLDPRPHLIVCHA